MITVVLALSAYVFVLVLILHCALSSFPSLILFFLLQVSYWFQLILFFPLLYGCSFVSFFVLNVILVSRLKWLPLAYPFFLRCSSSFSTHNILFDLIVKALILPVLLSIRVRCNNSELEGASHQRRLPLVTHSTAKNILVPWKHSATWKLPTSNRGSCCEVNCETTPARDCIHYAKPNYF